MAKIGPNLNLLTVFFMFICRRENKKNTEKFKDLKFPNQSRHSH